MDLLEGLRCLVVLLGIDQMIGGEQEAVDVVRVDLEGLGQLLVGAGLVLGRIGTGEQVVEAGVLGGGLRRLAEGLRGQGEVLLGQGQLGGREVGLDQPGFCLIATS